MAGGRRRFSKPGVAAAGRTVFVEGGLLNDWQDRRCPPPSSSTSGKPKRHNGGGSAKPRGGGRKDFGPAGRSLKTHQGNAFAYSYPVESGGLVGESSGLQEAAPVFLGGFGEKSAVTVFVDSRPQADPTNEVPSYDYYSVGFVGALSGSLAGLGFHEEGEVEGMEAGEGEAREMVVGFDSSSPISEKNDNKSDAFLSIGGLRLYTEDISSPDGHSGGLDEEEEDDDDDDDDDEDSFEGEDADSVEGSSSGGDKEEDGSEDETSSDDYDDGSDIDEEVMEDYLEGIGGTSELLKAGWLAEDFDKHDLDSSFNGESRNEVMEKLGGAALMNASEEYGMQKPRLKNKKNDRDGRNRGLTIGGSKSIALDDLFVKDCRTYSRKNKKDVPDFSWSWPCQPQTSKMDKRVRGEKKKHRKEMIAKKRRERMHNRGVDLEKINLKLRQMVVDEADILSFQPMHSRDCAQVQRLASIYHLRSGSQGSGKKRFVTVTRTGRTSLPSSSDKLRLEKLLGLGDEYYSIDNHDKTAKNPAQMQSQIKVAKQMRASVSYHRRGVHHSASGMLMKSSANPSRNIREGGTKATGKQSGRSLYADNPVSFVSCGMMQVDPSAALAIDSMENSVSEKNLGNSHAMLQEAAATAAEGSSKVGAFELHTKGFGSRMMTKMGFTEGSGLGKDGQGIALPIEAIIRPKSLGLGVQFSMDTQERSGTGKDGDSQKKKQKNQAKSSGTAAQNRQMTLGKRDDSRGIGAFERHTKGFGSKMMAKMGYVPGMGLGREAQGIAAPLAAVKLPKSLGLGASV